MTSGPVNLFQTPLHDFTNARMPRRDLQVTLSFFQQTLPKEQVLYRFFIFFVFTLVLQ